VARFGITVRGTSEGSFQAVLHNSVHPRSWLGRLYFWLIESGHHVAMEVALRRLAARARNATRSSAKERTMSRWESWRITPAIFSAHARLYRLLGGRLVGKNILVLTTTGRRSGRSRSTPLYFTRDREDYVIIASNGGEDRYPGWWYNVKANPDVEIQVGREHMRCVARAASDADTPVLFAKLSAVYGGYRRYREQTRRALTIFHLEPRARG
jgi:deazaflavin-dependent oxidoreductase (nitroreductase family)